MGLHGCFCEYVGGFVTRPVSGRFNPAKAGLPLQFLPQPNPAGLTMEGGDYVMRVTRLKTKCKPGAESAGALRKTLQLSKARTMFSGGLRNTAYAGALSCATRWGQVTQIPTKKGLSPHHSRHGASDGGSLLINDPIKPVKQRP